MAIKKSTKLYKELTEGLPESFFLTINWDEAAEMCDRDRKNCAIFHAIKGRRDVTQISVGFDEINFIWRGDARIAVAPSPTVAGVIARNDLAAKGEIPWPTGVQNVRIDLKDSQIKKDLREQRVRARIRREKNGDQLNENHRRSRSAASKLSHEERAAKRLETEKTRGRFV